MYSEIENTLNHELEQVAGNLVVPPIPDFPQSSTRSSWHTTAPTLLAAAVVIMVLITVVALSTLGETGRGEPAPVQSPSSTMDNGSVSNGMPEGPVVVSGALFVGGQQVLGRWRGVQGSGTHWVGERVDGSWWWGYDARPQQLEGTMYQPPVISPSGGYLARVVSEDGGAKLVGADTEEDGQSFDEVELPGAGLDPAVRAVAVTDAGLVVVAGTNFQRLWRPLIDGKTIDLAQTSPEQIVIGNTGAGLLINESNDNDTDGTQGEPYVARLSEDGTMTRLGAVPTHDVLEASEQWIAYVPPGTVEGEGSGTPDLRVQRVDGSGRGVLTPPEGWLFVAPGFRWESNERLLALVVSNDGGDEALVRCRPDPASCVLVDLP